MQPLQNFTPSPGTPGEGGGEGFHRVRPTTCSSRQTTGEWMRCWILGFAWGLGVIVGAARAENSDRAGIEFFETSIRPLLIENCHSCHGEKKQKGELRLDSRAAAMHGGELGPVIVPGKPDESLLIKAVRYLDAD